MPEKPVMHGRDHRPGGTDPIPGLGGVSLAVAYLWNISGTTITVATGNTNTRVPWQHFQCTDTTVFGTDTTSAASAPYHNTTADKFLYLAKDGLYVATGSCQWSSGTYGQGMVIDNPGGQWVLDELASAAMTTEDITTNASPGNVNGGAWSNWSHRMFYVDSTTGTGITCMTVNQSSGVNQSLVHATMGVFYLGIAPDLATIY